MAQTADPGYNPDMQRLPIPDNDTSEVQPRPMIDWAAPPPGPMDPLVDALVGDDPMAPGQPFVRFVSPGGAQVDEPDETVPV